MASAVFNNSETSKNNESPSQPLETRTITIFGKNGLQKTVPALHIGFMETRTYVSFRLPPNSPEEEESHLTAEEEEWLEAMTFFAEDLRWILKLPYHRFWSQVTYDENLHRFLESYLFQAQRDYDTNSLCSKSELLSLLKKIHKLVFLNFLRMSTYKESKDHHITPQTFAELIYDNFIFDVPKILDLCAVYGFRNQAILSKMIKNIFSTQPKYLNDLQETTQCILEAFSRAEERLFLNINEKYNGCLKLEERASSRIGALSIETLMDVISYIADTGGTLYIFAEIYPQANRMLYVNGAVNRIATFYEQVFPAVEKQVKLLSKRNENHRLFEDLKKKIVLSKSFLLKLFRCILNFCGIESVLNSRFNDNGENSSGVAQTEDFLGIFMEITSEKNFLHDYNALYPFETDLELFNEMGINLDSERLNYIFSSIHDSPTVFSTNFTSTAENGARPKEKNAQNKDDRQNAVKNLHGIAALLKPNAPQEVNGSLDELQEPCEAFATGEVDTIRDLFPHLGDGFIIECLDYYSYEVPKVINALLSDILPESLNSLDRDLERRESASVNAEIYEIPNSILSERRSIFDCDEFDVFSRNEVDMKKIHKGKKNKTPNQYQGPDQVDDFLKQLIVNYGSEETEDWIEVNNYEDEYDDTYDSAMVGLKETFIEDEPEDRNENPSEEKEEPETGKPPPLDFCMNPAILREKAEERRQAKNAARNRSGNKNVSHPENSEHGRQQKGRHKAQVGNHNRRKQSDFKKSRGMGPI
ncbi:activating signal cointegrator 1 complex subunit 2-like [Uloborus diversus]|uniref:activating signal cointegrator 1 complex subunit 2-like n=1 Tax=Uloborus diversus TaxID=327109 RepID=UPI00240A38BE|nr:activating signal cointegrator 1 complex subunit 2-like [Uloborus diversus]